jgi:hypothetical protein
MMHRSQTLRQNDALAARAMKAAALVHHELITLVYRKKDQFLDRRAAAPLYLTDIVPTIQAAEIKAINHVSVPSDISSTRAAATLTKKTARSLSHSAASFMQSICKIIA